MILKDYLSKIPDENYMHIMFIKLKEKEENYFLALKEMKIQLWVFQLKK